MLVIMTWNDGFTDKFSTNLTSQKQNSGYTLHTFVVLPKNELPNKAGKMNIYNWLYLKVKYAQK